MKISLWIFEVLHLCESRASYFQSACAEQVDRNPLNLTYRTDFYKQPTVISFWLLLPFVINVYSPKQEISYLPRARPISHFSQGCQSSFSRLTVSVVVCHLVWFDINITLRLRVKYIPYNLQWAYSYTTTVALCPSLRWYLGSRVVNFALLWRYVCLYVKKILLICLECDHIFNATWPQWINHTPQYSPCGRLQKLFGPPPKIFPI